MKSPSLVRFLPRLLSLALGLGSFLRAATAQSFEWIPLQTPASSDQALNIILTGDGYTAADKATFLSDCQLIVAGFSNKEPWKTYISHINFYASWVVSNQAGVSILNGAQVDTAFKAEFQPTPGGVVSGIVRVDIGVFAAYQAAVPVQGNHFFVINSTDYAAGDTAGDVYAAFFRDPSTSGSNSMIGAALHEAGHLIGGLSDEYPGGGVINPPINVTTDLNNIPWQIWLDAGVQIPTPDSYAQPYAQYGDSRVGAFQGGPIATDYRPTYTSIMSVGGGGGGEYGPVNSEALVLAIYARTGPMLSITPAAGTVQIGTGQQQAFTPVIWSAPTTIGTAWYVDGNFYASTPTLTLHYADLSVGTHTLLCVVKDTTTFVRNDPSKLLQDSTTWTIVVGDAPTIVTQPSSLGVTVGQSAGFSVTATGSNLTYQWRKGGQAIAGATASSYGIAAAQTSDAGTYDCVVTNAAGSVTSSAATLTVTGGTSSGGNGGSQGGGAAEGWYIAALAGCVGLRLLRPAMRRRASSRATNMAGGSVYDKEPMSAAGR